MNINVPSATISLSKQSTESTDCRSKLEEDRSSFLEVSRGETLPRPGQMKKPPAQTLAPNPSDGDTAAAVKTRDRRTAEENSAGHSCKIVRMHRAGKTIVFLKNLRKTTTKDTVLSAFSKYGLIVHAQLPFNAKKKRNLGYCYIVYHDDGVAQHLIQAVREVQLEDRIVVLDPFVERPVIHKAGIKLRGTALPEQFSAGLARSLALEGASIESGEDSKKGNWRVETRSPAPPADGSSPSSSPPLDASLHQDKPTRSVYFRSRAQLADSHGEGNLLFRVSTTPISIHQPQ